MESMDPVLKRSKDLASSPESVQSVPFPDEVLEQVLSLVKLHKDRSSVSLVCKDWYNAERWSRSAVFIGNCYAVSPEIVARRFPNIRSVTLKGKPRFSDFNLLPDNWGAHIQPWLVVFAKAYPFLEELRLKRMVVSDKSLNYLAYSFPGFKALSLSGCDGFSTNGLKSIATRCKNLTELDIQENGIDDLDGDWLEHGIDDLCGDWLSCFPDTFVSLEVLNFASLDSDVNFDALESLVSRCKALRVLKVNRHISLEQLQKLLVRAPKLMELGTGSFQQELVPRQCAGLETAFSSLKSVHTLSGVWEGASILYLPVLYPACASLTFLNLSYATLQSDELTKLLEHCSTLRRLWVLDTVGDKGLEAVGASCPLLEELRVFPADLYDQDLVHGVTETGFLAVSYGCPKLHYVLYFCRQMTNAAVVTIVNNCPNFTHFRLCIMNPNQSDNLTNEPMDKAYCAVVKTCTKLRRISISGLLTTDLTFEYIGKYAKNLETLSVAFAGGSDLGVQYVMEGCPKLRKLEIRDCPFGNAALVFGLEKYESMRSLWMSCCNVTMDGCRLLAKKKPRLNVEVIKEFRGTEWDADKVYVYRSLVGCRRDAPPLVLTL